MGLTPAHPRRRTAESCADACEREQLVCDEARLAEANTCEMLMRHFSCESCSHSLGADQPAAVVAGAPQDAQPGACLVNDGELSCTGAHQFTTRLCACH